MVLQIRDRYASGEITQTALARETSISKQQINYIVNRKQWAHV
jgi:plasmid maintenance system antidote protein VapI